MNPSDVELLEIDLDWERTARGSASEPPAGSTSGSRRGFDPRWLIAVAVVGYLIWLFGLGGNGDTDGAAAPSGGTDAAASTAATPADAEPSAAAPESTFDPALDVAADIGELTDLELNSSYLEVMVDAEGADMYTHIRPLADVRGDPRFAYIGADGYPIVVDTSIPDLLSIPDEIALVDHTGDIDDLALLRDLDDGVIGFDPDDFGAAVRVSSSGTAVVRRATGELMIVARTDAGIEYGPFVPGEIGSRTVLPASATIDIIDAVGVFVTPPSGGTFEATPDGLVQVTSFDMLTSNGTRWLERRRLVEGTEDWLVDADGTEWQLNREAYDVRGDVSISPDGQWLYLSEGTVLDDVPVFYGIETGEIVTLDAREEGLPGIWSPDSDFLASIDLERECLWMDFVNGLTGCVSLNRLSIPPLPGSSLVIY